MIKVMFLIVMSAGISLFGAAEDTSRPDDLRAAMLLMKYEADLPQGYRLVAAAKTLCANNEKFVFVSEKKKKFGKFKIEVASLNSLKETKIKSLGAGKGEERFVIKGCIGEFIHAEFEIPGLFRFSGTTKYLCIIKNADIKTGVLDDREWEYNDIINKNPKIPKKAWLEILKIDL